jgi:hypothetical protein
MERYLWKIEAIFHNLGSWISIFLNFEMEGQKKVLHNGQVMLKHLGELEPSPFRGVASTATTPSLKSLIP